MVNDERLQPHAAEGWVSAEGGMEGRWVAAAERASSSDLAASPCFEWQVGLRRGRYEAAMTWSHGTHVRKSSFCNASHFLHVKENETMT